MGPAPLFIGTPGTGRKVAVGPPNPRAVVLWYAHLPSTVAGLHSHGPTPTAVCFLFLRPMLPSLLFSWLIGSYQGAVPRTVGWDKTLPACLINSFDRTSPVLCCDVLVAVALKFTVEVSLLSVVFSSEMGA